VRGAQVRLRGMRQLLRHPRLPFFSCSCWRALPLAGRGASAVSIVDNRPILIKTRPRDSVK
jgi:hypothetical protein